MKLVGGVKRVNVVAYFATQYAAAMVMATTSIMLPFVIRAKEYYDIQDKDKVARIVGEMSFVADIT